MKKQEGLVLLVTIILLSVFSLLLLSNMQQLLLAFKTAENLNITHRSFYYLGLLADNFSHSLPYQCQTTHINSPYCTLKKYGHTYQYALNDLGLYPCLKIIKENKRYSSHHWLISIHDVDAQKTLHVRIAKPITAGDCFTRVRPIPEGILSWYLLHSKKKEALIFKD